MPIIMHNPSTVSAASGGYSHGLEVANASRLLYISGQIPEGVDGSVPTDFASQCRLVWQNINEILKSANMDVMHLAKVTTYLTSADQIEENSRIRQEVLGEARPALTVVIVQTLDPQWLLEVEVIAADTTHEPRK